MAMGTHTVSVIKNNNRQNNKDANKGTNKSSSDTDKNNDENNNNVNDFDDSCSLCSSTVWLLK